LLVAKQLRMPFGDAAAANEGKAKTGHSMDRMIYVRERGPTR